MAGSEIQPPAGKMATTPDPQNTSSKEPPVPPVDPPFSPEAPPPPPDKEDACTCRPDKTPGWKVLLEVVALVAVLAYTSAAFQQLGVMSRQLDVMRNGERPWIKVTPTEIVVDGNRHIVQIARGLPAEFLLKLSNAGKTPAQTSFSRHTLTFLKSLAGHTSNA
jgi:hypothetical protein